MPCPVYASKGTSVFSLKGEGVGMRIDWGRKSRGKGSLRG